MPKVPVELEGVPETLLWTLWYRAEEARRPDTVLEDPLAIELVERIDYPFAERFGPTAGLVAQGQALRSLCFDREIRRFMGDHPGGTVVALGEGLETAFQRTDDGQVRWLGVDLPETVAVRESLLGDEGPRHRSLARSAIDVSWMDAVDADAGVLITAQGLLMYLEEPDVHGLLGACAASFPGGAFVFDTAPRVFTALARRGALKTPGGFVAPPMPWGMDAGGRRVLARSIPGIEAIDELPLPRGRGSVWSALAPLYTRIPVIGGWRLTVCRATFQA
ncbi:MAG TPA: class I SAM-dependent methyltransferase [Solirubrobacteraceae bacterium]|nr:class I SAM-dependent methyltransferase [Solirubrobacteraceae bacterium]